MRRARSKLLPVDLSTKSSRKIGEANSDGATTDVYGGHVARAAIASVNVQVENVIVKRLSRATLGRLSQALKERRLTLVLGAGISAGSGLPSWNGLINALAEKVEKTQGQANYAKLFEKSQIGELRKVRMLEREMPGFRIQVRNRLYESLKPLSKGMKELSSFIDRLSKKKSMEIITYNFDDLLEAALTRKGVKSFASVYSAQTYATANAKVTIFHPHGFLPRGALASETLDSPIVFSEPSFHQEYFNYANWANAVQLHAFTRSTCLFIGLSFTDPNVRRLLDLARLTDQAVRHIAVRELSSAKSEAQREFDNKLTANDFSSLGVEPLWVDSYAQIPRILKAL